MAEIYFQSMRGLGDGQRCQLQVLKTIQLLRDKLPMFSPTEKNSDQIIYVVVNLAGYARVLGDDDAVRHHLDGIQRMVGLRGGIATISENKLLVEILR